MKHPILTAIGTGRIFDVDHLDAPAVMLCYAQATQDEAAPIEATIRERYPDAKSLVIAHVIDLHTVPGLFRGVAEGIMKGEFEKAARELPGGESPYDQVIILPDWDGGFVRTLGFAQDVAKRLGVAVFAPDGTFAGTAQEDGAIEAVLKLLAVTLE